jgi:hypothetical protein
VKQRSARRVCADPFSGVAGVRPLTDLQVQVLMVATFGLVEARRVGGYLRYFIGQRDVSSVVRVLMTKGKVAYSKGRLVVR